MSFLSGEAMFRALVSKDCYVTGSLRTSLFSFLLVEHEKRKLVGMERRGGGEGVVALRVKKKEGRAFLCFSL